MASQSGFQTGPDEEPPVPGWAFILGLVLLLLINLLIFWYLLVFWPGECERLSAATGGTQTCSLQPGAYIVGGINVLIIAGCIIFIFRWSRKKDEKS